MLTELEIILVMAQWCFGYGTMVFWLWHNASRQDPIINQSV